MVLKICAHARTIRLYLDAHVFEMRGGADAREHQQFWRIERGCRDDDLATGLDGFDYALALDLDTDRAAVLDDDLAGETVDQRDVAALQRRFQIGIGGGPAAAMMDRLLHQPETLLLGAVIVVGQLETGLRAGLNEGVEQRIVDRAALHMQRPIRAAPALLAAMAVFHALEVRQHIRIGPAMRAELLPAVKILGMATHVNEAVDRGGAADDLAARCGDAAVVEVRFGLGEIAPIIALHAHRPCECGRHLDEGAEIRPAGLDDDDGITTVFRQAVGDGGTCGAGADDDVICLHDLLSPMSVGSD
ncbi:hypothetical protein D3C80_1274500 [compost metagenome]